MSNSQITVKTRVMQEQILEAALRRFSHFGITKTSLTEVAVDLSISKQVLSYYYPDKQSLISALVEKLSIEYGNQLKEEMEKCGSVQEALLKITEVKGLFFEKYFMMISQADPRDFAKEGSAVNCRKTLLAKETDLLREIFENGVQSGELKKFDINETTQLLLETLSAFAQTMKEKTAHCGHGKIPGYPYQTTGSYKNILPGYKNRNMGELLTANAKELSFFYGMTSVSMDKLSGKAGRTQKKIHQPFVEQNELTNKIVDDLLQYQLEAFKQSHETATDVIDEVLKQTDEPFLAWASINQAFFSELQGSCLEAWQKLDGQMQEYVRPLIILNLAKGIQEKLYHDMDISFTADLRLQQLTQALDPAVFTERRMSMSELFMELTMFYLQGITTEKGKKLLSKYSTTSNDNK